MKRHFLKKQLYLEKIKVLFFRFLFKREVQLEYELGTFEQILATLIFFSKWQQFFLNIFTWSTGCPLLSPELGIR
jgi:hypothetical protein